MLTRAQTADVKLMLQHQSKLLRRLVDEQTRQRETLTAVLRLLERGRGARDQADAELLAVIGESVGDARFTSAQLIAHGEADPILAAALIAADITSSQQLGCLFRRLEGAAVSGFRIERAGELRAGAVWQVRVSET